MRRPALASFAILLALVSVAGAAQGPADPTAGASAVGERSPVRWNRTDALLVGQVAGTWAFGVATMGGKGLTSGVAVRGARPAGNGLFHGVVLFTHREGRVTLSGAYASVGGQDQRLPIGRTFEAKGGQIIVLGLMHFVKDAGTLESHRVVAFDNREETMDYLRRTYPDLLAGNETPQVVLAPGEYQPMEKLVELRIAIASAEARQAKRGGRFWVAGGAGTIAEVKVAGDSVQVLRFLPPVTYHEPVMNRWDAQGTLTFSSMTRRWTVSDGRVVELAASPD